MSPPSLLTQTQRQRRTPVLKAYTECLFQFIVVQSRIERPPRRGRVIAAGDGKQTYTCAIVRLDRLRKPVPRSFAGIRHVVPPPGGSFIAAASRRCDQTHAQG